MTEYIYPKKKICIIVDHPDRDLAGLVYLSEQIAFKNIDVILVPMYFFHEVFLIKPDYLIVNHGRKEAKFSSGIDMLIKFSQENGIGIFVLDTEGGLNFEKIYKKNIHETIKKIDKYFLWGIKKKKLVKKEFKNKFIVSGNPKYDLYRLKNYKTKANLNFKKKSFKNYILILTSFVNFIPIKGIKRDIEWFKKKKISPEFTNNYFKNSNNDFKKSIDLIKFIISKNSKKKFILRPHPFEDKDFYIDEFKDLKNVKIYNKGDIILYIQNAELIINHNCQTSFEAVLAKKECINISSISNQRTEVLNKITKNISTKKKLNKFINIKQKISNLKQKKNITYNYINNVKYNSSKIILNEILSVKKNIKNKYSISSISNYYIKTRGYLSLIKFFLKLIFDPKILLKIKELFGIGMYNRKKITLDLLKSNFRLDTINKLKVRRFNPRYFTKKISLISNSFLIQKR